MSQKQISLPVMGMNCTNCANTITRTLQQLDGISGVTVNYATESATVTFDSSVLTEAVIVKAIRDAGYDVAATHIELSITGMNCTSCAASIERTLKSVPGTLEATVNFATEQARVAFIPDRTTRTDLIRAVEGAGYGVVKEDSGAFDDAEMTARESEIRDQTRKFWVGLTFALPLLVLSMARDFGLLGGLGRRALGQLANAGTCHTCTILCRLGLLCWEFFIAPQQIGEYGCARCDGLIGGVLL